MAILRRALRSVPVIVRNSETLHLSPALRIREGRTIRVSAAELRGGSSEALCNLAAFFSWCRSQDPSSIEVSPGIGPAVVAIGLDTELRAPSFMETSDAYQKWRPLPVCHVSLLADTVETLNSRRLREISADIGERISRGIAPSLTTDEASLAIDEFIAEGLLNVHDHAYEHATNPHLGAWISASIFATRLMHQKSLVDFNAEPLGITKEWLSAHA